jgi:hypothetical protein
MSKDSKTPLAFPYCGVGDELNYSKGMTLLDYFAASFITSGVVFKNLSSGSTTDEVAAQAYALARAMLKARQA